MTFSSRIPWDSRSAAALALLAIAVCMGAPDPQWWFVLAISLGIWGGVGLLHYMVRGGWLALQVIAAWSRSRTVLFPPDRLRVPAATFRDWAIRARAARLASTQGLTHLAIAPKSLPIPV